jgi:hypothetical protein
LLATVQPLEDGLMIPLQRMPVYELLLRKLSASTSSDHAVGCLVVSSFTAADSRCSVLQERKSLDTAMEVVKSVSIYTDQKSRQVC